MKKKLPKKLVLNKETVRKLNDAELKKAVGGGSQTTICCPCTGTSTIGPTRPVCQ